MINAVDVKYIRDKTGLSINTCKSMAILLNAEGYNITSEEAEQKMCSYKYTRKAERYSKWLEIKDLIDEFGSFE